MRACRPFLIAPVLFAAGPLEATDPLPWTADPGADVRAACEVPVLWRVDGIDPRFGLSEADAAGAVRAAAFLWESALGRVLLFRESDEGIPIRFEYDERQEETRVRQARIAEVDAEARSLEESAEALELLRSRLESRRSIHQARLTAYRDRLATLEETVEFWNARGGAPAEEVERLRQLEAEVDELRAPANAAADEVNRLVDALNRETEAHNLRVDEANRRRAAIRDAFPVRVAQSGEYLESTRGIGPLTLSRDAEIRIYQFEDRDHLTLVVAHELGHALGLGHTGIEGTLMAAEGVGAAGMGPPDVTPGDVAALRELCPEL